MRDLGAADRPGKTLNSIPISLYLMFSFVFILFILALHNFRKVL